MKKSKKKQEKFITKAEVFLPTKILKENIHFFVLILFAVVALYINVINGEFLTADDLPGIVNNPMVKNFEASMQTYEIEKMFPALIYKLFGMNAVAFHTFSLS